GRALRRRRALARRLGPLRPLRRVRCFLRGRKAENKAVEPTKTANPPRGVAVKLERSEAAR
ncbi:MAG: hypothetical protein AAFU79_32120, partial [Myxococcota bacterium]